MTGRQAGRGKGGSTSARHRPNNQRPRLTAQMDQALRQKDRQTDRKTDRQTGGQGTMQHPPGNERHTKTPACRVASVGADRLAVSLPSAGSDTYKRCKPITVQPLVYMSIRHDRRPTANLFKATHPPLRHAPH
mmetsp:Transcript_20733/g.50588  ORF Transcript_20733/g.50588 Transcript_20733/m.50588 type:complete len:133 (-) Transcript_20733:1307-1705(-)